MVNKRNRCHRANKLLEEISSRGREFFKSNIQAYFEVDERGRVWFVDDYTEARIYTHYKGAWRRFSHGGTLKGLISKLAIYISKGETLKKGNLGPWPTSYSEEDPWGYGEENMVAIRRAAKQLWITRTPLDVQELRESEEDGYFGNVIGYWCAGHVDKQEFAIQANQHYETVALNINIVSVSEVRHSWTKPAKDEGLEYGEFYSTEQPKTKSITCILF